MACRNAFQAKTINEKANTAKPQTLVSVPAVAKTVNRLLFGADSKTQANDLLQNNIEEFEWVVRNKIYPNFYGRYLTGENCLTKEEIDFIHRKGCKIAAMCHDKGAKQTEEQGTVLAKKLVIRALELGIPAGTCIFLEIDENEPAKRDFMKGFAKALMTEGYTPGFKANTDANFGFDREFSRGLLTENSTFRRCLIWAVAPILDKYNGIRTAHWIHPDTWTPFAPSGMTRNEIAVWQYGKDAHPIEDDKGRLTFFNLNLVRNEQVITGKMF